MNSGPLRAVVRHVKRLIGRESERASDRELLGRFATSGDEAAFELLLLRHGPMVLGVCCRLLRHSQDAEDAFQATFLTLVRKAASIGRQEAMAGWLYRVAYRVALRARQTAAQRPSQLPDAIDIQAPQQPDSAEAEELRRVLDEELTRLPEKYRILILLCYFQGKTHEEAAQQLGCPTGTVSVRLQRARQRLLDRLTHRGLTLTATALTFALCAGAAHAALPSALVGVTLQAALLGSSAAGVISPTVAALMKGIIASMAISKLQVVLVLLAGLTIGAAGGLWGARYFASEKPRSDDKTKPVKDESLAVISERDGKLLYVGVEYKPGERVPVGEELEKLLREGKVYREESRFLAIAIEPKEVVPPREQIMVPDDKRVFRRWKPGDPLPPGKLRLLSEVKLFRRLNIGDRVERGDRIALVNPSLALEDVVVKISKLNSAQAEMLASLKTRDEADRRYQRDKYLFSGTGRGTISIDDVAASKLAWERYTEEVKSKEAAITLVQQELQRSLTTLRMHEMRSPVDGVVKTIYKRPGEGVKALDLVLRIQPIARP